MAKFRKRPVVIEAFQMTPERRFGDHSQEWPVWLELYPCKPDIFTATYEPVE